MHSVQNDKKKELEYLKIYKHAQNYAKENKQDKARKQAKKYAFESEVELCEKLQKREHFVKRK